MMLAVTIFCLLFFHSEGQPNNVCEHLEEYAAAQINPNCWYEKNVDLEVEQIIKRYGYPFESHEVRTEDGYIVTMFRVPSNGSAVLMGHTLAADTSEWFSPGNDSLVFVLADNGYDVWLPNSRGTKYSPDHEKYTVFDREYWDFSFHEVGLYEVPAVIDYIVSVTGRKGEMSYIGHSWGTTISYVYASLKAGHAQENLRTILSLSPMGYMEHAGSPLIRALVPLIDEMSQELERLKIYGIGPNVQPLLDGMHEMCSTSPTILICAPIHSTMVGESGSQERYDTWPVAFSDFPSGISFDTIFHYGQLMNEKPGRFIPFDYGADKNMEVYGSPTPPDYPLENITVPVHMFYGSRDAIAKEEDVYRTYADIKSQKSITKLDEYTMYNFMAAKNIREFYESLLQYLG